MPSGNTLTYSGMVVVGAGAVVDDVEDDVVVDELVVEVASEVVADIVVVVALVVTGSSVVTAATAVDVEPGSAVVTTA
jgi:hypothetical protein